MDDCHDEPAVDFEVKYRVEVGAELR